MMQEAVEHDILDEALRSCGSDWSAAQTHGLLCGRLAVDGTAGIGAWRSQVLDEPQAATPERNACADLLDNLAAATWQQLAERQSQFDVLLPADDENSHRRAQALADWSEGFLHGLVTHSTDESVRRRLGEEPLSDLIRDLLELTRAEVGAEDSEEETELAYAELVEYVRVAAQLAFEHLADLREEGSGDGDGPVRLLH